MEVRDDRAGGDDRRGQRRGGRRSGGGCRDAPLLDSGRVSRQEMALLTDRVLVNQGRPQRYGSQLLAVDGRWEPKPMEAPAQVDQRRAAIGQMPLADYVCVASKLMPPPPTP